MNPNPTLTVTKCNTSAETVAATAEDAVGGRAAEVADAGGIGEAAEGTAVAEATAVNGTEEIRV